MSVFKVGDKVSYFSRQRNVLVIGTIIEVCTPGALEYVTAIAHEYLYGTLVRFCFDVYRIQVESGFANGPVVWDYGRNKRKYPERTVYGARLMLVQSVDGRPIPTQRLFRSGVKHA